MNEQTPDPKAQFGPVQFPTTQLTDVVNVDQDPERAEQAMRNLCERYYVAIEAWFRMKQPDSATDLAHDFIKRWLSRNRLLHFQQKQGIRFRFYLARCLGNFLKDYLRGTEHPTISIEDLSNTGSEIADRTETSPPLLDCQIACAVHQRTMKILRAGAKEKKNQDPNQDDPRGAVGFARRRPAFSLRSPSDGPPRSFAHARWCLTPKQETSWPVSWSMKAA